MARQKTSIDDIKLPKGNKSYVGLGSVFLIVLGALLLLHTLSLVGFGKTWPLLIIVIGTYKVYEWYIKP